MINDPHFEREQDKYDNPIPSRELREGDAIATRDTAQCLTGAHAVSDVTSA